MSFQIKFSEKSTKFLRRLSSDTLNRVKSKFKKLSEDPFRYLEHYEGDDCHKFRVGGYRALIDVDFDRNILFIRVFDKRGRVYKR